MGPEEIPLILHGDCLREGHYCFLEQGGLTQEGRYPWAWGGHSAAGRKDPSAPCKEDSSEFRASGSAFPSGSPHMPPGPCAYPQTPSL